MSLLDWLLGRGRDPLEPPREAAPEPPVDTLMPVPAADEVRQRATQFGVTAEVMQRMLDAREELAAEIAREPRAWGFDLLPAGAQRRDLVAELRSRTRLQGPLAESFVADDGRLLALAPDMPTMPDGTPLDEQLVRHAGLAPEAARDVARHVRATMQARLGRALDEEAFEHAVREAAWDHELDAGVVTPPVLGAVASLL